jgi:hypothetical protein
MGLVPDHHEKGSSSTFLFSTAMAAGKKYSMQFGSQESFNTYALYTIKT